MGNMILIKDRHSSKNSINFLVLYGKYDTYKGSTLKNIFSMITTKLSNGKYDTYKGSTLEQYRIYDLIVGGGI